MTLRQRARLISEASARLQAEAKTYAKVDAEPVTSSCTKVQRAVDLADAAVAYANAIAACMDPRHNRRR